MKQRRRIHYGARKRVSTNLGTFLQYANADVGSVLPGHLFEPYRCGKSSRTAANNNDVMFRGFAETELFDESLCVHFKEQFLLQGSRIEATKQALISLDIECTIRHIAGLTHRKTPESGTSRHKRFLCSTQ